MTDANRAQFEAYAKTNLGWSLETDPDGSYWDVYTENSWKVWQAALTSKHNERAEPVCYRYKYKDLFGHEVWSFHYGAEGMGPILETQALYAAPQGAAPVIPMQVIKALFDASLAAWELADGTEERMSGEHIFVVDEAAFDKLAQALDRLETAAEPLPSVPGYVDAAFNKISHALAAPKSAPVDAQRDPSAEPQVASVPTSLAEVKTSQQN